MMSGKVQPVSQNVQRTSGAGGQNAGRSAGNERAGVFVSRSLPRGFLHLQRWSIG